MQKEVMSTLKQSSCKKMLMLPLQNRHTVGIQGGTEMAVMMYKLMAKCLIIINNQVKLILRISGAWMTNSPKVL